MTPKHPPRPSLSYAPPLPWRRRYRNRLIAIPLLLLAAIALLYTAPRAISSFLRRQEFLQAQQACLTLTLPPAQITLTEEMIATFDPERHRASLRYASPPVAWNPPEWIAFARLAERDALYNDTNETDPPVLFLHRLSCPAGDRLVAITDRPTNPVQVDAPDGQRIAGLSRHITIHIYAIASQFRRPEYLTTSSYITGTRPYPLGPHTFRYFAPTLDPADPSAFSIPWQLDTTTGNLHGHLEADGKSVTLTDLP